MIVFVSYYEGSQWNEVSCSRAELDACLESGTLTSNGRSDELAAIKLFRKAKVAFDFTLQRLGHGLVRYNKG